MIDLKDGVKYSRPVLKNNSSQTLISTPAPACVFEGSMADVSVLAGLLVDKFAYHLPLYRQHQRLQAGGITLSRSISRTGANARLSC